MLTQLNDTRKPIPVCVYAVVCKFGNPSGEVSAPKATQLPVSLVPADDHPDTVGRLTHFSVVILSAWVDDGQF